MRPWARDAFENPTMDSKSFVADIASASGGTIEIRLDNLNGDLIGICNVKNTGSLQNWNTQSFKMKKVKGIHDVYFVFKGDAGDLFNFNRWKFSN